MPKPKVYIAGAYSDTNVLGVLKNIGRGQYYAAQLFKHGFAPFVPWLDKEFVFSLWDKDLQVPEFYEYSMEWLRVSDVVFVVPNHEGLKNHEDSHGVQQELQVAIACGIPIFYDVLSILQWYVNDYLKPKI